CTPCRVVVDFCSRDGSTGSKPASQADPGASARPQRRRPPGSGPISLGDTMRLPFRTGGGGGEFDPAAPGVPRVALGPIALPSPAWPGEYGAGPARPTLYRLPVGWWVYHDDDPARKVTPREAAAHFADHPCYWAWDPEVNTVPAGGPLPVKIRHGL